MTQQYNCTIVTAFLHATVPAFRLQSGRAPLMTPTTTSIIRLSNKR